MKEKNSIYFFLILILLFASCHRDLTDPFIPKDKKFDTQFKFSSKKNRTVEKHGSFSRSKGGFNDSFASGKRGRSSGSFGKDSFSSRSKKKTGGGFGKDSYSSRSGKRTGGGFGKDSYSSRSKKRNGGGFGKDSYSSRSKHGGFGRSAGRKYLAKHSGGKDSYSLRHKRVSGLFRFSKTKNSIVSENKFFVFGTQKRNRESGSFSSKHRKNSGQYSFSNKKRNVAKKHFVFSGTKRLRSAGSFNVRVKKRPKEFGYNADKKRVSKIFTLIKRKDTDPGSFGHGSKPRLSKQYVFNKKTKRVKKKDSIWWDLNQSFRRKKYKKKEMELELFDPKMKRKLNIGK